MTRRRRRGRKVDPSGRNQDVQYWNVPYAMLRHEAFRALSGAAVKVLLELRTRFNGFNNGSIVLSLDEAARRLSLSKSTVHRGLGELEVRGFIRLKRKGQWYGRRASEWALTFCPIGGEPATNDWRGEKQSQDEADDENKFSSRYSDDTVGVPDGVISVPRNRAPVLQ